MRVSSSKQADEMNLERQEEICREYCKDNALDVLETFTDAGESAYMNSADRPKFREMMAYFERHHRKISHVVFATSSRFSRDAILGIQTATQLFKQWKIIPALADQPELDFSNPEGWHQFCLRLLDDQRFSMRNAVCARSGWRNGIKHGRWPAQAKLGYKNKGGKVGANSLPNEENARFIVSAFEQMATGLHTQEMIRRQLHNQGFRTNKGGEVKKEAFRKMLRDPFYAGFTYYQPLDENHRPQKLRRVRRDELFKGQHEPLIAEELFWRVQDVLDGRAPKVRREERSSDFIKGIHHICRKALTGYWTKGGRFGYYKCPSCKINVPKAKVESAFLELLQSLQLRDECKQQFPAYAAEAWTRATGDGEREAARLKAELTRLEERKSKLVLALAEQPDMANDFKPEIARTKELISEARWKLDALDKAHQDQESWVELAEVTLLDMAKLWELASPADRARVRTLLFGDDLCYSRETGFSNSPNTSLFSILSEVPRLQEGNGAP